MRGNSELLATLVDDKPMAEYDTVGFYEHSEEIKERMHVLPTELQREIKRLLRSLTGLRNDRNASVHTVWSQYGFGWRDDPYVEEGDPRRLLTFKVDQAT